MMTDSRQGRKYAPADGCGVQLHPLIRDLISEACSVLQHDTDVLYGLEDYEIEGRRVLNRKFLAVFQKHKITLRQNE